MTNAAIAARKLAPIFLVAVFTSPSAGLGPLRRRRRAAASPLVRSWTLRASIRSRSGSSTPVDLHRCGRDLRYAHHARRQGRGRSQSWQLSWSHSDDLQDLDLQAAPGREIPRRHAVQCASLQGELRSAEGPRQQVPLRLLHHQRQGGAGARRIYRRLQSHRSFREFAGDADTIQSQNNVVHSPTAWKTKGDDYNRNPVGTGPYILEIMDGRRSHGSGEESGLLGQGPSLSRSHHPEAAARRAVAICLAAIGRGRHHLGRRERRRQHP